MESNKTLKLNFKRVENPSDCLNCLGTLYKCSFNYKDDCLNGNIEEIANAISTSEINICVDSNGTKIKSDEKRMDEIMADISNGLIYFYVDEDCYITYLSDEKFKDMEEEELDEFLIYNELRVILMKDVRSLTKCFTSKYHKVEVIRNIVVTKRYSFGDKTKTEKSESEQSFGFVMFADINDIKSSSNLELHDLEVVYIQNEATFYLQELELEIESDKQGW